MGSFVSIQDVKKLIFAKHVYTKGAEVRFAYQAGSMQFAYIDKYYQASFIGRVIQGTVLSTKNETLHLKLEIDDVQKDEEAYDYQWQPESGNMLYCMPQVGSIVSLYFGDWDEQKGRVINTIRQNGDSCSKMSNPEVKMLTTEQGKQLKLEQKQLLMTLDEDSETATQIQIMDDNGITFQSQKAINIVAVGELGINGKSILFSSPKKISCLKGNYVKELADSTLEIEDDINVEASNVKIEMTITYIYPNIQDAPEVCNTDSVWGKVALGIFAAVATAVVVGTFVLFGAAILAAAGATLAVGYGTLFCSGAIAGALAGSTAVVCTAVSECDNNYVSDYGDYMAIGMANSAASTITGAIAAPVTETWIVAKELSKFAKYSRYGFVAMGDAEASYIISCGLLGSGLDDWKGHVANMTLGFIFGSSGTYVDDTLKSVIQNEKKVTSLVKEYTEKAYGKETSPENIANLYNFLDNNTIAKGVEFNSYFNGAILDGFYKPIELLAKSGLVTAETSNIARTVAPTIGSELTDTKRERYEMEGTNNQATQEEIQQKKEEHKKSLEERGKETKRYYIVRGAKLRCTCGSHERRLDMEEDRGKRVENRAYPQPFVCQSQCEAGECKNIKNFGICSGNISGEKITLIKDSSYKNGGGGKKNRITGIGCVPDLLGDVWMDTQGNILLKEEPLVIGSSFLACSHGGFIEIETSGEEYMGELEDGNIVIKE